MRRGSKSNEFEMSLHGVPEEMRDESWYSGAGASDKGWSPSYIWVRDTSGTPRLSPVDLRVDERIHGVASFDCSPEAYVIEEGRIHSWHCNMYGEEGLIHSDDNVRYVDMKGGSATLEKDWYVVVGRPLKGLCTVYDARFFDGEEGKLWECE